MLPYSANVGFFETEPILEVNAWAVRTWQVDPIDLFDTLPAVRKIGDDGDGTFRIASDPESDVRYYLDYWFSASSDWGVGVNRNWATMLVFGSGIGVGTVSPIRVVNYPGVGPSIDYGQTGFLVESTEGYGGSIRLSSRFLFLQLRTGGGNVPSRFQFSAALRAV